MREKENAFRYVGLARRCIDMPFSGVFIRHCLCFARQPEYLGMAKSVFKGG